MTMTAKLLADPYLAALKEMERKSPNPSKAFPLLEKALNDDDPRAAYALGTWYLHGFYVEKNVRKGLKLIRAAAKRNVPSALYDLAVSYEKGEGVKEDASRAAELYLKAALHGDDQAVFEFGRCLYHGVGVPADRKLARVWLDRARDLGFFESKR